MATTLWPPSKQGSERKVRYASFGKREAGFNTVWELREINDSRRKKFYREGYKGTPPDVSQANRMLDTIVDKMFLPSAVDQLGFRDDPALRKTFSDREVRLLLLPEIERRLELEARLITAKRAAVISGISAGRVSYRSGKVVASEKEDKWMGPFWGKQEPDPLFRQQVIMAELMRENSEDPLKERPELAITREIITDPSASDADRQFIANRLLDALGEHRAQEMLDAMPTREHAVALKLSTPRFASVLGKGSMTWRGKKPRQMARGRAAQRTFDQGSKP